MQNNVGIKFNFILILYLCTKFLVAILFESMPDKKVLWDSLYAVYPFLSIILAFFILVLLLLWGALIFKVFWNKLFSDVFRLREINLQESLSIILIISIFTT